MIQIGVLTLVLSLCPVAWAQTTSEDTREQDHEELRAMMRTITSAISNGDTEAMIPLLHETFSITMVDQTLITSADDLRAFFQKRFTAEDAILESMTIEPKADILTEFLSDTVGVNYGTSTDTYKFKSGKEVVVNSRWSATVIHTEDGWKLSTVHAGVDMLDNPVIGAIKSTRYLWGGIGGIVGLLVGMLLMRLKRSR